VIRRASQLFAPTLREAPADAEAISHKLLVRGGFIRQVSAGVWTFLPLGWRVHEKIVQIVREEMDAIGGQEMLMPVLTPAELWQTSGRYAIPEVFKLNDRSGREFVLPMTHGRRSRSTLARSRATGSCRRSSTTSRSRTATSRVLAAGCCACASSS
jgi:prolyl-tRNA synthetase